MTTPRRAATAGLIWALTVSSAGAYYHFVHYTSKSAPYVTAPEKFDLNALPNKTVAFFVSSAGPKQLVETDSFSSVINQVRLAARAWNAVPTSDLRVTFAGLYLDGTPQSTPGGEVVFDDDIPPGLLAFSTHTAKTEAVKTPDGSFFPITRSIIHLSSDLTERPGPSYTDSFLLTVVHEMGHALGLQHTFTSSVMSTSVTRATSVIAPLDADDMAAISLLYPRNLSGRTGSITGRVTAAGQGVHMASVVALRPNGAAISALSNPDGTYRIDGIPQGPYYVYVHPLPPTADIVSPIDPDGNAVKATGPFDGVFYPNTIDIRQASAVSVRVGTTTDSINFAVRPRLSMPVFDVSLYSYFGQTAVHPAYVSMARGSATIAAAGNGLGSGGRLAPGLGVSVVGSALIPPGGVRPYGTTPTYLALDINFGLGASAGPLHFIFSQGTGVHVLPRGLNVVRSDPPTIDTIAPDTDGNVLITGSHFAADSQVYFDGLAAATKVLDDKHASAVPPPGESNQRASVTVMNGDGQNSTFVDPDQPPVYAYAAAVAPKVTFSPATLPAGARAMIEVTGVNTKFADGLTTVGFGSSDLLVGRVWVLSPTRALVNVSVAPTAQAGASLSSVISGFQMFSQPAGFQTAPAKAGLPVVEPALINAVWVQSGVFPGSSARLTGLNLGAAAAKITINDQPVAITNATATQITLIIPASLKPGPAILRLNNGTENAYPVVISIDAAPPAIAAIQNAANVNIDPAHAPLPGDALNLVVTGLADSGAKVDPVRVRVTAGGVDIPAAIVQPGLGNVFQVQIKLAATVATGARVPVTVTIDGRTSLPFYIPINPAPAPEPPAN